MKSRQKNNAQRRQTLNVTGHTKALQKHLYYSICVAFCQYRRSKNESKTPYFFGERM